MFKKYIPNEEKTQLKKMSGKIPSFSRKSLQCLGADSTCKRASVNKIKGRRVILISASVTLLKTFYCFFCVTFIRFPVKQMYEPRGLLINNCRVWRQINFTKDKDKNRLLLLIYNRLLLIIDIYQVSPTSLLIHRTGEIFSTSALYSSGYNLEENWRSSKHKRLSCSRKLEQRIKKTDLCAWWQSFSLLSW